MKIIHNIAGILRDEKKSKLNKKKISELNLQQRELLENLKKEWFELATSSGKTPSVLQIEQDIEWLYCMRGFSKPKIVIANSIQEFIQLSKNCMPTVLTNSSDIINSSLKKKFMKKLIRNTIKIIKKDIDDSLKTELKKIEQDYLQKITHEILMPLKTYLPYGEITSNSDLGLSAESWMISFDFINRLGFMGECDEKNDFLRYCNMIKSGVWYAIFHKEIAMICSTPTKIQKDDQGRFHSVVKSAIQWRNKQNDYFIHGVNFEKSLWKKVAKRKLTIKEILQIQNIEQRHVAIQIYGYDTLVDDLEAELLDKSQRGNELFVLRDTLIENRSLKLLKYGCPSTGRIYFSFVPDDIYRADYAMAWKFNLSPDEYSMLDTEA